MEQTPSLYCLQLSEKPSFEGSNLVVKALYDNAMNNRPIPAPASWPRTCTSRSLYPRTSTPLPGLQTTGFFLLPRLQGAGRTPRFLAYAEPFLEGLREGRLCFGSRLHGGGGLQGHDPGYLAFPCKFPRNPPPGLGLSSLRDHYNIAFPWHLELYRG